MVYMYALHNSTTLEGRKHSSSSSTDKEQKKRRGWFSYVMDVGTTNKSALFRKQIRSDLPVEWKKLTVNSTTIVGVLSCCLNPHFLHLQQNLMLDYSHKVILLLKIIRCPSWMQSIYVLGYSIDLTTHEKGSN